MKLLIISAVGELGGGAESMLYEAVNSIKEEIEVEVLFMQKGKLKDSIEELNVKTFLINSPQMRNIFGVLSWMKKYEKFIKRQKPTLVLNWMPKAHLFTAIPNYIAKIPTYWWQHGVPEPPNIFDKITPKLPAKKIGSSSTIAKLAQQKLTRTPVFCSFPGSDINKHSPNNANRKKIRSEFGIDEETILLGNVGRIQGWKRQDLLIEALDQLLKENKKVKLLLVGGNLYNLDDEFEIKINTMIKERKLEDFVITTGNQLDVAPFYDAMDIYVHTAKGEPFGIVMVEAMLHAKPIVAVKSPGSIEIVKNNETGILVENEKDLAETVNSLIKKDNLLLMGKRGRERAVHLFSNKRMGDSILEELTPYIEAK